MGGNLEVVLNCSDGKLPILALVKSAGQLQRPTTITANMTVLLPAIVRRGAIVRLLMNGEKSRVTMPAVSLDSGALGEKVRVRIPGTNHFHVAKVAGTGLVIEDAAGHRVASFWQALCSFR